MKTFWSGWICLGSVVNNRTVRTGLVRCVAESHRAAFALAASEAAQLLMEHYVDKDNSRSDRFIISIEVMKDSGDPLMPLEIVPEDANEADWRRIPYEQVVDTLLAAQDRL